MCAESVRLGSLETDMATTRNGRHRRLTTPSFDAEVASRNEKRPRHLLFVAACPKATQLNSIMYSEFGIRKGIVRGSRPASQEDHFLMCCSTNAPDNFEALLV